MNPAQTIYSSGSGLPPLDGEPTALQQRPARLLAKIVRRDLPGQSTQNRFLQIDQYQGAVYIAINALMTGLRGSKVKVLRRSKKRVLKGASAAKQSYNAADDWEPVPETHPACQLFEYVNPQQTLSAFLAEYMMMLKLCGRVFVWAPPGQITGKPRELWVIRTPYVQPSATVNANYPLGSWIVTLPQPFLYGFSQAGVATIDAREMVEHRLPHPRWPWDGMSPLQAAGLQIDTLMSINQARKLMMDYGSTVDGIVAIDGATEKQLLQYEQRWQEKYTGQDRGQRVMFTDGQGVNATALTGFAPKEMSFEQGYEQLTKFVMSLFGVPSVISGMTDAGSYSQLYASLKQFQTLQLGPEADDIAEHLTKHLIRPHYGPDLKLVIEIPDIQDVDLRERQYDSDKDILTVNQRLRIHGHEPIGEEGDVPAQIYLAKLQQEMAPQGGGDPMAALMGGGAPGAAPAGDLGDDAGPQAPQPDNPDSEGSLPPLFKSWDAYYSHLLDEVTRGA